jgi:hypothetical protein
MAPAILAQEKVRLVLKIHGLEYPRDYNLLNIGGDRCQAIEVH